MPRRKKLIERAYMTAEALGIALWCEDEVGPYQTIPYLGASWQMEAHPIRKPHEYFQEGTAKMLTLLLSQNGRSPRQRGDQQPQ